MNIYIRIIRRILHLSIISVIIEILHAGMIELYDLANHSGIIQSIKMRFSNMKKNK